jgi:fucose permease
VNAVLGPSLPYIRSVEHISYVVAALHQVAFAVGGGIAGVVSAGDPVSLSRRTTIAGGLGGAAVAALAVGYGNAAPVTIAAALLMGLAATLALIRVWAALADAHGDRRAVAMSEGEVAVSLAGIATPLVIGALAATAATWRLAFAVGAATLAFAIVSVLRSEVPEPSSVMRQGSREGRLQPTLVIVIAVVALEFALSFWLASYLNDSVRLTRDTAVALVSTLYAANLAGRLGASVLVRTRTADRVLLSGLGMVLLGLPFLLSATSAIVAVIGIVVTGAGIGALFPLTSSLHVQASEGSADSALGEILFVAAFGQMGGALGAGAIAQATNLRVGLVVLLPLLALLAAVGLAAHRRDARTAVG